MKHAAAMGHSSKLFQLTRAIIIEALEVSETIHEAGGLPIYNLQRRLVR